MSRQKAHENAHGEEGALPRASKLRFLGGTRFQVDFRVDHEIKQAYGRSCII
jgi:hypothetical protein